MPRRLRLHVPGAIYHVTLRGNHRQDIFFTPRDRQLFEEITAQTIDRLRARVHAYCWMTNHVHMVIQVSDTPLGRIMLRVAGQYARRVQAALHTTGHLFEKRYYSVLVDADEYLLELVRYVHLNPVRARLVDDPLDYTWSSHHAYCGMGSPPWLTTDFVLSMFRSGRTRAIESYRRFIEAEVKSPGPSPLHACNPNDGRILGSDDFVARLFGEAWRPKSRRSLDNIIDEACIRFSVTIDSLTSTTRSRRVTIARAWAAHEAVRLGVASLSAVARYFGRTEGALRQSVKLHFGA